MSRSKTGGGRRAGAVFPRKVASMVLAAALSVGALAGALIAAPASHAAVGGGSAGGGGAGPGASNYLLLTYDNLTYADPPQGWGNASIDAFKTMLQDNSVYQPIQDMTLDPHWDDYVVPACQDALAQASARGGGARSRVVQVGMTMYQGGTGGSWVPAWGGDTPGFTSWYQGIADAQNSAYLVGYNATGRDLVKNTFLSNIPASNPRAVCVAVNEAELISDYPLNVSTDKGATFGQAGSQNAVNDVVHTDPGASNIRENVSGTVNLHWDGPEGQAVYRSKAVTLPNNGDTRSPNFTPADFGWDSWPAGDFWFDVIVNKQGHMQGAIDTADNDPRESWTAAPLAPTKVITHGGTATPLGNSEVLASGMFYDARISAHSNGYASSMTIRDTTMTDKVFIGAKDKDVASAAYVLDPNGNKVGSAVMAIDRSVAGKVTLKGAVANMGTQGLYTLVVPTYVLPTGTDYTITDNSQVCYTATLTGCSTSNSQTTRKVTPDPNKVWVLDPNGALTASDPNQTNQSGADNMVFLPGDAVSAVVNGKIPGSLAENLSTYRITDDWTKAAKYVDFSDASKAKVFFRGSDVSSQFSITVSGTVTTATANAAFLATTKGLGADAPMKLVISGAFRTDYLTAGQSVILYNSGSEVWNNETSTSNSPAVFTWTPDPGKQVDGSADESGDKTHDNIDGLSVFPNQKLEYSIQLDVNLPQNTALGVKTLGMVDTYDPHFTPDKASVEIWDMRTAKPIARSAYALRFDAANHSFTADFTPAWIASNIVAAGANSQWQTGGWLTVRFTGAVNADTAGGTTVRNQAFQVINGVSTATEIPAVKIPSITPGKEALDTNLDSIDGKTVVEGDHIMYRLTLDGGPARDQLAYNVHKLGMVDDYDEGYLSLSAAAIKVTNKATGVDVTDKFNVQVANGVAYVFAKQVDSTNAYGDLLKGDPQPADLGAYDSAPIVPNTTSIIDQSLLGQQYWITMDAVVSKEVSGYTITNQARENIQNTVQMTKVVSNPLTAIDPGKDVVVDEASKDTSLDGKDVKLFSTFNYRLNSSEIPANRAYKASSWSISDGFDKVHDSYTGIWAIYANSDLYQGDQLIFKDGALLADSAGHESVPYDGLFTVTFDADSGTFNVTSTQKYLDMVNTRGDLSQGFSVYTKMERIAPGDAIVNTAVESYNSVDRDSNKVTTSTTESPAISVESYTLSEGFPNGDRDDSKDALALSADQVKTGTPLGFRIRNTGDVALSKVSFASATALGTVGTVSDFLCEVPLDAATTAALNNGSTVKAPATTWTAVTDLTALAIGQSVDCKGMLQDMKSGMLHSDLVTVKGESVFTAKQVTASDAWNAKAAAAPLVSRPAPPAAPKPSAPKPAAVVPKLAGTGEAVSTTNPLLVGGGLAAILAALAAAVVLLVRRRRDSGSAGL
jgi:adhesin isopeptide-forming family sspB-C2 type protein